MNDPTRHWHPFGRTEEEDLTILQQGGDTGWWDDSGHPAPWPPNFLHPDSGWAPAGNTPTGQNDAETTAENPPF